MLAPVVEVNALLLLELIFVEPVIGSPCEALLLAHSLRVFEKILIFLFVFTSSSLGSSDIDWLDLILLLCLGLSVNLIDFHLAFSVLGRLFGLLDDLDSLVLGSRVLALGSGTLFLLWLLIHWGSFLSFFDFSDDFLLFWLGVFLLLSLLSSKSVFADSFAGVQLLRLSLGQIIHGDLFH